MAEERHLLAAIKANPHDRLPRLVYADWLEERDDPRGELVRIEEEVRTLPIHTDRFWALKPRRRELRKTAPKAWLKKLGYDQTDYLPVFTQIPAGWKGRWRLLREYVERWYGLPMHDVDGPLLPASNGMSQHARFIAGTVDAKFSGPNADPALSPSLREWMRFIRELQCVLKGFEDGSGDGHGFLHADGRVDFFQLNGNRDLLHVRHADRRRPDPPVWHTAPWRDASRLASPHVTTLALHYLLLWRHEPEYEQEDYDPARVTKTLLRRLAKAFPPPTDFDGLTLYERPNVIAVHSQTRCFGDGEPTVRLKVRPPADADEVAKELWG